MAIQLAEVAPDGVDVYLDNMGGPQLQAAVKAARTGARFVLVGALSGQLAVQRTGRTAPVQLDSFDLLLKKITMRGYSADDDPEVRSEWNRRFADWLRSGNICFPHVTIAGLEAAPGALRNVIEGRHFNFGCLTIRQPPSGLNRCLIARRKCESCTNHTGTCIQSTKEEGL